MLEGIDALTALERFGTVSEAAARLRLTQSAVSKRIQALQQTLGLRLIEPDGRRVRLTPAGSQFLERARPLAGELRALTERHTHDATASFSLALADSIAASWGPSVVRRALAALPQISVELHAHRSILLIENVRLGRYHIGLCTDSVPARDLIHHPLVEEPMVIAHAAPAHRKDFPLITIEPGSATWRAIEPALKQRHPELLRRPVIPVETFSAALQMMKAGFGDALVPLGLAMEMGFARPSYTRVTAVSRQVSLLTRKTVWHLESFALLRDRLTVAASSYFRRRR